MGYNTVTPLRNTGGLLSPESLSALDKLGRELESATLGAPRLAKPRE